jgi:phage shock protein E
MGHNKKKPTIIDVRTPIEFMGGHVAGSRNIPLNELATHLNELKNVGDIIVCCASGARSASAAAYLNENGVSCMNGGPWTAVNYYMNNQN